MGQSIPRPLITGPSAWIGTELAKRPEDWTYQLSPSEIAEIEAATAANRGRDIATITRVDFPLPTLGPALDRLRDEVLNGRGFVLVRGLPVEGRQIEESAAAYWGIGTYFGSARSQNAKGHVLGHVRDMGLSSKDPNVRIYQTTERQNFHTDSCDIVSLLCLKTAKSGGLSSLTSSMSVYNVMATQYPELVWRLFN
ncbi:MAG TPA: TauD/TfdA family dioxygenase, partial [Acetobacteraceae bacterium]|nr:TauD/TfdA family dioxygenase [Acetobacteraceae bacterium]